MVTLLGPGIGEVDVKTVDRTCRHEITKEDRGIGSQDADVAQVPAPDSVRRVTVELAGPLDSEEVHLRLHLGLRHKEGRSARPDLDVNRAGTSENPGKIDLAAQIFRYQRDIRVLS